MMHSGFMLALRSILFACLGPGMVTVVIPYFLFSSEFATRFDNTAPWRYLGLVPISVGAGILFRCIWDFAVTGRGTLAPVDPPRHLVVRGLYRYVRNPMYVGVVSILLGEALLFLSRALLWYAVGFWTLAHLFVVLYEEPVLRRQFDESYDNYCRRVHRWLPRRTYKPAA
jgi:protein-S-isoprenylcysteine O-methyltransferase Ste14